MNENWRRICGFSAIGPQMALVWLSIDPEWGIVRVTHAQVFRRPLLGQVASELRRGDRAGVPVAWANREFADELLEEHHIYEMLPDASPDTPEAAERYTSEMLELMEVDRFKVGPGCDAWTREFETFQRVDGKTPRDSHPLMAATRYAMAQIKFARGPQRERKALYPKVSIV